MRDPLVGSSASSAHRKRAPRTALRFLLAVLATCAWARATPLPVPRIGPPLESGAAHLPEMEESDMPAGTKGVRALVAPETAGSSLSSILERSAPAVVTISSVLPDDGPVRGAGFFIRPGGLIVTSHHLVDQARDIRVKTRDGNVHRGVRRVRIWPDADLALLRVSGMPPGHPCLSLADASRVRAGEVVVAIGHPLGLEYTLSTGIVSALRAARNTGIELIQFSAPVSAGCSGGPLLNAQAQVIGVVSLSHPDGQSLNFAIPSNYLRPLLNGSAGLRFKPHHGHDPE